MAISDEIAHILFHVDAEAANMHPSRNPGVPGRAQRVRVALAGFGSDNRNLPRKDILGLLIAATAGDPELKTVLSNMDENDSAQKIRRVLSAWVGGPDRG